MAHPNADLIDEFYRAFAARDAAAMGACYAPDVRFTDPVFPMLEGDAARGMWEMLCERGQDLRIEHEGVRADDTSGVARWNAWYTFSATGRQVHNVVDATLEFADGKIVRHVDSFDFYRWSRQALGLPGVLLGWTPLLRNKVRRTAGQQLERFMAKSS